MALELRVDDVLRLKKPHTCGANAWQVYRVGADLGLRCQGCGRMMLLPRQQIERRVRRIIRDGEALKPESLRT